MRGTGRLARLDGCDPDHQPSLPSPMVLCVCRAEQDSRVALMNGSLSHTMCSLVMTSSLPVVIASLSLTGAWFEGLERGDPNEFDCRAPAIFSRVCQIPGPSRSVCSSALHNFAWTRGRRVGEGSPRGLRDRGAGGKGRATDLRTGRGSVALGVLPLVSALPVPAVPCRSLPLPAIPLPNCMGSATPSPAVLPCQSRLPAKCLQQQQQHKLRSEEVELGRRVVLGCNATSPLPAARGCHFASWERRRREWRFCLCRQTCDIPDLLLLQHYCLPTYVIDTYRAARFLSQSPFPSRHRSFNRQSSILRYIVVISFAPSSHRHTLSRPVSLPAASLPGILILADTIAETG